MCERNNDMIIGRNPVYEALKNGKELNKILIAKGNRSSIINEIISKAKNRGTIIKEVDKIKLDKMTSSAVHQGIIAFASAHSYSSVEDILNVAKKKNEDPFIIIAEKIQDPHNLGAIIRTAECTGAHGVIISKDNSSLLNYTVDKASAGALEYVPVAKVTNISRTIKQLQSKNIWVFATAMDGKPVYQAELSGAIAIVLGNEGKGVSQLTKKVCDETISLPMKGNLSSLNVSVSAGVFMYEVLRRRYNL